MLNVQELTKSFGDTTAVSELSFAVGPGEIYGLLGENGAGKTTTMRMLATLLKPTSGTATISGHDIIREPEAVRASIGVLFEGGLYDRLTAYENVQYFGRLYGLRGSELHSRIQRLADMLEMQEFMDRRASTLSKGMRQKVAIARAIIHDPPVLLMDEPTSGLDVTSARLVHDFVRNATKDGRTVLFSSHNMTEVERLCHRVGILHRGRLRAEGTITELKELARQQDLEDAFVNLVGDHHE